MKVSKNSLILTAALTGLLGGTVARAAAPSPANTRRRVERSESGLMPPASTVSWATVATGVGARAEAGVTPSAGVSAVTTRAAAQSVERAAAQRPLARTARLLPVTRRVSAPAAPEGVPGVAAATVRPPRLAGAGRSTLPRWTPI